MTPSERIDSHTFSITLSGWAGIRAAIAVSDGPWAMPGPLVELQPIHTPAAAAVTSQFVFQIARMLASSLFVPQEQR